VAVKFGVMEAKTMLSAIPRRFLVVQTVGGISSLEAGVVVKSANGFNINIEARSAETQLMESTNF
jgi:hypothetical protein